MNTLPFLNNFNDAQSNTITGFVFILFVVCAFLLLTNKKDQ